MIRTQEIKYMKEAIQTFGVEAQENHAMQELAELIQAISKHMLKPTEQTRENIAEEMADARIMLDQLNIIFANSVAEAAVRERKLHRLHDIVLTEIVKREG